MVSNQKHNTMNRHRICNAMSLLAAAWLLTACNSDVFYDGHRSTDEEGWVMTDPVTFTVNIDDTAQYYNIFFDLRVGVTFPYANAFFFITTHFPDSTYAADTLECPLADPTGKWYGKLSGRYVDNRYYFRRNTRFPMTGSYCFEVTHGMRDIKMAGIKDVGLRMEKTNL